ncbi:hypothetical protein HWV62_45228 [Athelia sp. TMB]|nr:hypothetical protein HWV62_45228 [Athelia sp. TMB]
MPSESLLLNDLKYHLPPAIDTNCPYLDSCRTLAQMIAPAGGALLAAVYLQVHRNVPDPRKRAWYWNLIFKFARMGQISVVTLLFPEWTFAWAMRSYIIACRLRPELESARKRAIDLMRDLDERNEKARLTNRRPIDLPDARSSTDPTLTREKVSLKYEITQTFFLLMGGLHIYHDSGRPIGPLTPEHAIKLINCGKLMLPSLETINALSAKLSVGKLLAFISLITFVTKCIARKIESLALAPLEVMALAHTFIAMASFWPWWSKPMNIDSPVHVPLQAFPAADHNSINTLRRQRFSGNISVWDIIYAYVLGGQDALYDLNTVAYMPTFWSGDLDNVFALPDPARPLPTDSSDSAYFIGNVAGLGVAIIFGAIHFLAWDNQLPYSVEHLLWRVGSIVVTGAPVVIICTWFLTIVPLHFNKVKLMGLMFKCVCVPFATLYMASRLTLIAIVLTSTFSPAAGVYVQVSFWKYIGL